MGNAGAGLRQTAQLLPVEMDAVPIQPRDSMYSRGRIPHRSRTKRSSSFVSQRWVWSRTPRSLAKIADCRSSSSETLKGEQGASATIRMENRDGSW